ncbi:DUF1918 domain-containing protein [Streptomyces prasinus]|uniref:DUF1918 domain-containing protein n=1 Tax=Streptomyces prasinus TaxID=67345 RepID=UPI003F4CDA90
MRSQLGDQLVVENRATGVTKRDGEIAGLHHADGSPPYDVRWSDTDEVSLVFSGPDAHIRHIEHRRRGRTSEVSRPSTDGGSRQEDAESGRTPPGRPSGPGTSAGM